MEVTCLPSAPPVSETGHRFLSCCCRLLPPCLVDLILLLKLSSVVVHSPGQARLPFLGCSIARECVGGFVCIPHPGGAFPHPGGLGKVVSASVSACRWAVAFGVLVSLVVAPLFCLLRRIWCSAGARSQLRHLDGKVECYRCSSENCHVAYSWFGDCVIETSVSSGGGAEVAVRHSASGTTQSAANRHRPRGSITPRCAWHSSGRQPAGRIHGAFYTHGRRNRTILARAERLLFGCAGGPASQPFTLVSCGVASLWLSTTEGQLLPPLRAPLIVIRLYTSVPHFVTRLLS